LGFDIAGPRRLGDMGIESRFSRSADVSSPAYPLIATSRMGQVCAPRTARATS
jgi:hypothetical protein